MQIDWTTFILQIVNFIVLVWLLKRFLYHPVLDAIARRRTAIEKALGEAKAAEERAAGLRGEYERKIAAWNQESNDQRAHLAEELAAERTRRLDQIEQDLREAREKNASIEQHREAATRSAAEHEAMQAAAVFAARLLSRLAGPDLDERIVAAAVEDLGDLAPDQVAALRAEAERAGGQVKITSARPLSASGRATLSSALERVLGQAPALDEQVQPDLLGGVRLAIGPWLLAATLQDELRFFARGLSSAH